LAAVSATVYIEIILTDVAIFVINFDTNTNEIIVSEFKQGDKEEETAERSRIRFY
jgi:hypothetical protein